MSQFFLPALIIIELIPLYVGYKYLRRALHPEEKFTKMLRVILPALFLFFIYLVFCVWLLVKLAALTG